MRGHFYTVNRYSHVRRLQAWSKKKYYHCVEYFKSKHLPDNMFCYHAQQKLFLTKIMPDNTNKDVFQVLFLSYPNIPFTWTQCILSKQINGPTDSNISCVPVIGSHITVQIFYLSGCYESLIFTSTLTFWRHCSSSLATSLFLLPSNHHQCFSLLAAFLYHFFHIHTWIWVWFVG